VISLAQHALLERDPFRNGGGRYRPLGLGVLLHLLHILRYTVTLFSICRLLASRDFAILQSFLGLCTRSVSGTLQRVKFIAFARLTPNNTEAKRAFNDVVAAVTTTATDLGLDLDLDLVHHGQIIVIQDYQHDRSPTPRIDSFSATATESDEPETDMHTQQEALLFQGFYEFSFDVRPRLPTIGWIV